MRLDRTVGPALLLLPLLVAPLPLASAADAPARAAANPGDQSAEAKILFGLEQICREQGWGHWWNGRTCLTNEEASKLTRDEALDLIRRNLGRQSPLF